MERDRTFCMNVVLTNPYPEYKEVLEIMHKEEDSDFSHVC